MKKALYSALALLVVGFCASPSQAQKSGSHGQSKSNTHSSKSVSESHESPSADSDHSSKSKKHSKKTNASTTRSNAGGDAHGTARAEEVQTMNTKADQKRGFTTSKGVEKAEIKTGASSSKKGQKNKK